MALFCFGAMDDFGSRLKTAADQVGGLDRLADLIPGMSRRSLSDYVSEKTDPRAALVKAISEVTGVDAGWILTGKGEPLMPTRPLTALERQLVTDGERERQNQAALLGVRPELVVNHYERVLSMSPDTASNQSGMIRLPIYTEVLASAGPGAVVASEQADGVISFDPRFLRDQGARPDKCVIIWAHGDSMMPTIPDGSALIVDHSQKEIKNGSIMVIGVDDDLLVKRIRRRSDGLIELISDNRTYETETLGPTALQQLRVIGRVVYFCRTP